jgi:UDP-N-acetyl-D-glucosamine dehydrogenase
VRGSSILVAGIAYKRDIDDMRESPALDIMALLHQKGARISYHDPYIPTLGAAHWPGGHDLASVPVTPESLRAADCVVILTDHRALDCEMLVAHAPLVVDSRNAIKTPHAHVFKLGAPSV